MYWRNFLKLFLQLRKHKYPKLESNICHIHHAGLHCNSSLLNQGSLLIIPLYTVLWPHVPPPHATSHSGLSSTSGSSWKHTPFSDLMKTKIVMEFLPQILFDDLQEWAMITFKHWNIRIILSNNEQIFNFILKFSHLFIFIKILCDDTLNQISTNKSNTSGKEVKELTLGTNEVYWTKEKINCPKYSS